MSTGLIQQTLFSQEAVKTLHQSDFNLNTQYPIDLIYNECMLVLFYGSNTESKNLAEVWYEAAKQVVGPIFAACNLMVETKVAEAFTSLNMVNGPYHWAGLKTIPFIMVYQNGKAIAFYNGERSVQSLIDYALTLACRANYHEPFNVYGGMQADNNILISGITQYGSKQDPFKQVSTQFTSKENLRGYDIANRPMPAGSPGALEAAAHRTAAEEASGEQSLIQSKPATGLLAPGEIPSVRIPEVTTRQPPTRFVRNLALPPGSPERPQ